MGCVPLLPSGSVCAAQLYEWYGEVEGDDRIKQLLRFYTGKMLLIKAQELE